MGLLMCALAILHFPLCLFLKGGDMVMVLNDGEARGREL